MSSLEQGKTRCKKCGNDTLEYVYDNEDGTEQGHCKCGYEYEMDFNANILKEKEKE